MFSVRKRRKVYNVKTPKKTGGCRVASERWAGVRVFSLWRMGLVQGVAEWGSQNVGCQMGVRGSQPVPIECKFHLIVELGEKDC